MAVSVFCIIFESEIPNLAAFSSILFYLYLVIKDLITIHFRKPTILFMLPCEGMANLLACNYAANSCLNFFTT